MIVDASVAVKWVVFEDGSEQALELLGRNLAAPAIWLAEASNAAHQMRQGRAWRG